MRFIRCCSFFTSKQFIFHLLESNRAPVCTPSQILFLQQLFLKIITNIKLKCVFRTMLVAYVCKLKRLYKFAGTFCIVAVVSCQVFVAFVVYERNFYPVKLSVCSLKISRKILRACLYFAKP